MAVDRCVCANVTFAELKKYAQEHRCGFGELRKKFGCGRGCAFCVPYIRIMLKTGRTSFEVDEITPGSPPSRPPELPPHSESHPEL